MLEIENVILILESFFCFVLMLVDMLLGLCFAYFKNCCEITPFGTSGYSFTNHIIQVLVHLFYLTWIVSLVTVSAFSVI